MKVLKSIAVALCIASFLPFSCKEKDKKVIPVDSTQILPSGIVKEVLIPNSIFADTGMTISIKGSDFKQRYKDDYLLLIRTSPLKWDKDSMIYESIIKDKYLRDSNLVLLTSTQLDFKLPKHCLYLSSFDSVYIYFTKLKRSSVYVDANHDTNYNTRLVYGTKMPMLPIYKMLRDTLVINKTYQSKDKNMIQGSYSLGQIKVLIHGLEYPNKNGYFISTTNYSLPASIWITLGLVATQDLFTLPDGWHDFEIYESGGKQRKFVEETGKTKVYIKNVP